AAHGRDGERRRMGAPVPAFGRGVPGWASGAVGEVLAPGAAHRRGVRRPEPGVLLPGAGGVRGLGQAARSQVGSITCGAGPRWGATVLPSGRSSPVSSNMIT